MVTTTQTMPGGDPTLIEGKRTETSAPGGTAYAAVGGDGFRPAAQVGYSLADKAPINGEKVTAGAAATLTLGNGPSASMYGKYELSQGKVNLQMGLSAEYSRAGGVNTAVGVRVDYNANGPVQPYASAIASTNGKSGVEAGVCTQITTPALNTPAGNIPSQTPTVCAGVQRNQSGTTFVIGLGRTF